MSYLIIKCVVVSKRLSFDWSGFQDLDLLSHTLSRFETENRFTEQLEKVSDDVQPYFYWCSSLFSLFILYYSIDERRRQYFPDKQEGKLQDDFDLVRFFLLM